MYFDPADGSDLMKFRFAHMPSPPRAVVDLDSDAQRIAWKSPQLFRIPARPAPTVSEDLSSPTADGGDALPALVVLQFPHSAVDAVCPLLAQLHSTAQEAAHSGSARERELLAPLVRERHGGAFDRALLGDVAETPLIPPSAPWLVLRVEPLLTCPGRLMLTNAALYFQPAALNNFSHKLGASSTGGVLRWPLHTITSALRRRRLMREIGLEVRADADDSGPTLRHTPRSSRRRRGGATAAALSDSSSDSDSPSPGPRQTKIHHVSASSPAGNSDAPATEVAARHAEVLATGGLISHARGCGVTSDAAIAAAAAAVGTAAAGATVTGLGGGGAAAAPPSSLSSGASAANHVLLSFQSPSQRDEAYALLHAAMDYVRAQNKSSASASGKAKRPSPKQQGSRGGVRGGVGRSARHRAALDSDSPTDSDCSDVAPLPSAAAPPLPSLGDGSVTLPPARSHGRVDQEVLKEVQGAFAAWRTGALSNYEYLCVLNSAADRSPLDLTQYPVFPWVLSQYNKEHLDLSDPRVFRDLSKPVGALNPQRLEGFLERFREMPQEEGMDPPFMYGTHYSTPAYVLFFLVRAAPQHQLKLQAGKFDSPDRQFHSVGGAWGGVTGNGADLKELTHEFYDTSFLSGSGAWRGTGALATALPSAITSVSWVQPTEKAGTASAGAIATPHGPFFAVHPAAWLRNSNGAPLGRRMNGEPVEHVTLPPWAGGDPAAFVLGMRAALESDHVSAHLHQWVDLIFGVKQQGVEAEQASNVFHPMTYEGFVDLERVKDATRRHALQLQIAEFGQTPRQLFTLPHPPRRGAQMLQRMPPPGKGTQGGGAAAPASSWSGSAMAASFVSALGIRAPAAAGAGAASQPDVRGGLPHSSNHSGHTPRSGSAGDKATAGHTKNASVCDVLVDVDAVAPPEVPSPPVAPPVSGPHSSASSVTTAAAAEEGVAPTSPQAVAVGDKPEHRASWGTDLEHSMQQLGAAQWRCAQGLSVNQLGATASLMMSAHVCEATQAPPPSIQGTPSAQGCGVTVRPNTSAKHNVPCAGAAVFVSSHLTQNSIMLVLADSTVALAGGDGVVHAGVLPEKHTITAACSDMEHGMVFLGDNSGRLHTICVRVEADSAVPKATLVHSLQAHPVPVAGVSVMKVQEHACVLVSCSEAGEVCVWSLRSGGVVGGTGDTATPVCMPGNSSALFGQLVRSRDIEASGGPKPKAVSDALGNTFRPLQAMSTGVSQPEGAPAPMHSTCVRMAPEGFTCDFAPLLSITAAAVRGATVPMAEHESAAQGQVQVQPVGVWGESNGTVVWFNALTGQPMVAQDVLSSRWGEPGQAGFDWAGEEGGGVLHGVPPLPQRGQGITDVAFVHAASDHVGGNVAQWFVAAGTRDGAVALFDPSAELHCLVQVGSPVSCLAAVHGAEHILAIGCDDGAVRLMHVPSAVTHGAALISAREAAEAAGEVDPEQLWLPQLLLDDVALATLLPCATAVDNAEEGAGGLSTAAPPVMRMCSALATAGTSSGDGSILLKLKQQQEQSAMDPESDASLCVPRSSGALGAVACLTAALRSDAGTGGRHAVLQVSGGLADGTVTVWEAEMLSH